MKATLGSLSPSEIQRRFGRRRQWFYLGSIIGLILYAAIVWTWRHDLLDSIERSVKGSGFVIFFPVVIVGILLERLLRCPACNQVIRKFWGKQRFCKTCGANLLGGHRIRRKRRTSRRELTPADLNAARISLRQVGVRFRRTMAGLFLLMVVIISLGVLLSLFPTAQSQAKVFVILLGVSMAGIVFSIFWDLYRGRKIAAKILRCPGCQETIYGFRQKRQTYADWFESELLFLAQKGCTCPECGTSVSAHFTRVAFPTSTN